MAVHGGDQPFDTLALLRDGLEDRRGPAIRRRIGRRGARLTHRIHRLEFNAVMRWRWCGTASPQTKHQLDLDREAISPGTIRLVHNEDVGDLHQSGLERLDR